MIPFPEYLLWIGAALLAGYVAALSWRLGVARHFPLLFAAILMTVGVIAAYQPAARAMHVDPIVTLRHE